MAYALEPARYQVGDADEIFHEYMIEGVPVRIEARDTRQERTGVHARVTITEGGNLLAWTAFNVERDEDRVRLANSAYGHMHDTPALVIDRESTRLNSRHQLISSSLLLF